jgi:hypothetical protein
MRRVYLHSHTPSRRGASIKDRDCFTLTLHPSFLNLGLVTGEMSGKRWRSWLGHCATSQKAAGSISDGIIGIFHWLNPSCRTVVLGTTQTLTEISTSSISLEVRVADKLDTFMCRLSRNSGILNLQEPKESVQACNWICFYCSCASSLAYAQVLIIMAGY